MLLSAGTPITEEDSVGTVHDRLSLLGADLLVKTISLLEREKIQPVPQNDAMATYAAMLASEDEVIKWHESALAIFNRVRGMDPWPGARTLLGDRVLKIWRAKIPKDPDKLHKEHMSAAYRPGVIIASGPEALSVMTGTGPLEIAELQLQGGRRLPAQDFLRGNSIPPGTHLGGPALDRQISAVRGGARP
jgi:methionyl-tRNA formyltransferase